MRILLCLIFLSTFQCTYSQTAWTANSFKFSEDTISLVDMTGATAITIGGTAPQPKSSGLINFPSNFSFHFGLNTYNNFAVSSYGFITLGQDITSNTAEEQEQVIAPLRSEATWDASVKLVGSAPNRKFIIEWNGIMQPSGEATKFQLWLSERNGKIEFVYKSVLGFGFLTDIWQYKVFCKASILGQDASCALAIQSTNIQPVISYSIIPGNNNTI